MTAHDPHRLADRLLGSLLERAPLAIDEFPALDEESAYEVQHEFVRGLSAATSDEVAGFKLSMTSPETQALANASGPAYGTLFSAMILAGGAAISLDGCFEPRLELELQIIVEQDLSPGARAPEITSKCSIAPGVEVPDSRFRGWFGNLSVGHIVSDLGLAGHVVVGASVPLDDVVDLPAVTGELQRDGGVVAKGVAANVMGNPVAAIEWLTERVAREGRSLRAGDIISSGTLCMPLPAEPGSYRAAYTGLGGVSFTVAP